MDAIKRDIYVLRDTIQYRIEVTRGTNMIPIELTIRDFNIPTTATAVAYAFSSRNDEPSKMMCDIVEKTIKFTPSGVFFETGLNQLMIRIINDGKRLISFEVPVWCKDNKIRESDKSEEDQQTLIEQLLEKNGNLTDQVDKERKRIDNLVAPGKSAIGLAKKQMTKAANKLSQTEGSHTHSTSWTSTGSDDDATFLASVKDKNVFVMDCFCRTHSSKTSAWENTYHEAEATITINDDSVSVSATYKTTDTNTDAAIFTVVLGYDEENREIADIRVDSDGVTHDSAGAAVRAQTKDVPAMRDCLQSPYVDVDLLELGNINKSTGAEEDSTKILRSERFKWNKGGKITAPSGYVITTANYTLQTHIGDNGAYTREVYQSTGGYANGMSHPQADSDKDVRRLLIKRSDGADINVEDLRGKITTNVPDLRAMDVLKNLQEKQIETDPTLENEGMAADAAETGKRISQVEGDIGLLKEDLDSYVVNVSVLNIYDKSASENIVGYALEKNGKLTEYDGRCVTSFIKLGAGTDYQMMNYQNAISAICFYDKSKVIINKNGEWHKPNTVIDISAENFIRYIRVELFNTTSFDGDSVKLVICKKGLLDGSYHEYNEVKKEYKFGTSDIDNTANFITWLEAKQLITKPYKNLKWYALGDSYTEQGYYTSKIVDKTGMILTNYGVGGTRLADSDGNQTKAMCYRYLDMSEEKPDLITVMGGTNDCYYSTLGKAGDTSVSTVAGAIYVIYKGLQEKYPNTPILFASMPVRWDTKFEEYANIMIDTCKYWRIPCVDIYHNCGFNSWNKSIYNLNNDGIHVNENGGKVLAQLFIDGMNKVIY